MTEDGTAPGLTPSQTVGPYLSIGLFDEVTGPHVVDPGDPGAIVLSGRLLDGAGAPVPDGMVEVWQAGPSGRYPHPADTREELPLDEGFTGFGRSGTVDAGRFELVIVKPGRVPWPDGRLQAPHLTLSVFARGLLKHAVTRMYFPDEAEANASDPVLLGLDEAQRRSLTARPAATGLELDIVLQGPGQTTFFAV